METGTAQQEKFEKQKEKLPFKIFNDMSEGLVNSLEGNALRKAAIYLKGRAEVLTEKVKDETIIEKWQKANEELATVI